MKIITVGDDGYIVLGRVSGNTNRSSDEFKSQYRLADTILRNGNELFICMKIIEAEFTIL